MVTEWLLQLGAVVSEFFWGLFPDWEVPAWLVGLDDQINTVLRAVAGMSVWVPWPVVIAVTVVCLVTYLVCLVLKYGRAVLSYLPFFGGAG